MNQIKCPHCGTVFTIDEADYRSIVTQIKDHVFEEELQRREKQLQDNYESQKQLLQKEAQETYTKELNNKQREVDTLQNEKTLLESNYKTKLTEEIAKQNEKIAQLQAKLNASLQEKESAVETAIAQSEKQSADKLHQANMQIAALEKELQSTKDNASMTLQNALQEKEREVVVLKGQIERSNSEKESAVETAIAQSEKQSADKLHQANMQIADLEKELQSTKANASMTLQNALQEKEKEVVVLKGQIERSNSEKELAVEKAISATNEKKNEEIETVRKQIESLNLEKETIRAKYDEELKSKEREIADQKALVEQYKDFKIRLSTKMIGESLEQHCAYEFNRQRMAMFPNAYFEKDNDARSGSKGDFIFRDYDEDHEEIVSIMFEMKNENETTATKHKNEDFLKELDKDRKEKGCEYAVLVSMLEADNDLYNEGIVDVSYRYPKMYVIRPQFFIAIITLLKNASLKALGYKKQLEIEKNNNIDLTHFEENMNVFKQGFSKNYESASKKFAQAIDEIDKSITHLQKIKDALTSSNRQLQIANNKAQDLTIRKLTKNAPSVRVTLEEISKKKENDEKK